MGPCREPADGDRPAGRRANAASRQGQSQKRGPATGRREARKGGSPRYAAMERRPARASSQRGSPPQGGNPRRSACRRSVPFGLAEGGKTKVGVPRAIKNRGDDARLLIAPPKGEGGERSERGGISKDYVTIASPSISISQAGSIARTIWIMVEAGRMSLKNSPCARPASCQLLMSLRNIRVRTMCSRLPPASFTAFSIISRQ